MLYFNYQMRVFNNKLKNHFVSNMSCFYTLCIFADNLFKRGTVNVLLGI